jgi:hypothetical protein
MEGNELGLESDRWGEVTGKDGRKNSEKKRGIFFDFLKICNG